MKRNNKFFSMLYVVLCLAFFYLPILVTMIFSFNSSKSLTRFTGFSLRWYQELLGNGEVRQFMYLLPLRSLRPLFLQYLEPLQRSVYPNQRR